MGLREDLYLSFHRVSLNCGQRWTELELLRWTELELLRWTELEFWLKAQGLRGQEDLIGTD